MGYRHDFKVLKLFTRAGEFNKKIDSYENHTVYKYVPFWHKRAKLRSVRARDIIFLFKSIYSSP